MRKRNIYEALMENILENGWSNILTPTTDGGFLGYTVGLTMQGLPELCTYGEDHVHIHELLNELAGRQREAGEFVDGQVTLFRGERLRVERTVDLRPFPMMRAFFADTFPAAPRVLLIAPDDDELVDLNEGRVLVGASA